MATIYDVCREAGVSMATVSRVINGSERVRPKTRERVVSVMEQLGYKPSHIAQSLASKFTNSIGIQVSELTGSFYGPMMSGNDEELHKANKQGLITSGRSSEEREKHGIESLISRQCDALILHVEAVSDEYLLGLSKRNVPFVLLNRYIEEIADQCIVLDDLHGGYIATKSQIELGHTDIAYISGPLWKGDAIQRLNGHKKALDEHGIPFDEELCVEGDYFKESGIAAVESLLSKGKHFSAVVCGNDEMAAGAIVTLRNAGLSVPRDISIVGYDDIDVANYLYPRLTTVKYPLKEMASMAARWVLKNVYNQDVRLENKFVPDIIHRDSCSERKVH